jgi:hypothetical protein
MRMGSKYGKGIRRTLLRAFGPTATKYSTQRARLASHVVGAMAR